MIVDSYTNMNLLAHRSHALRFRDANEMQSINLNAHLFLIYFIFKIRFLFLYFILVYGNRCRKLKPTTTVATLTFILFIYFIKYIFIWTRQEDGRLFTF
jgi:hypothetical protein